MKSSAHLTDTCWSRRLRLRVSLYLAQNHILHTDDLLTVLLDAQRAPASCEESQTATATSATYNHMRNAANVFATKYCDRYTETGLDRDDLDDIEQVYSISHDLLSNSRQSNR